MSDDGEPGLSHLDESGAARMVDVGAKEVTEREARADRAQRAYMLTLAAKSAAARKKAAPGRVITPGAAATRTDHDAAST